MKREGLVFGRERGGGGSIWSPLGNYRLSRRPKSQRLNKEMKRNLKKMDEPPGKHPLFIRLVSQMITNDAHSRLCLSEGSHRGGVAKSRARVFMSQCGGQIKRERVLATQQQSSPL